MKRKFYWDLSVDEKMKRNRLFYLIFGAFSFVSFYVRFSLESALTFVVVIAIIGIVDYIDLTRQKKRENGIEPEIGSKLFGWHLTVEEKIRRLIITYIILVPLGIWCFFKYFSFPIALLWIVLLAYKSICGYKVLLKQKERQSSK